MATHWWLIILIHRVDLLRVQLRSLTLLECMSLRLDVHAHLIHGLVGCLWLRIVAVVSSRRWATDVCISKVRRLHRVTAEVPEAVHLFCRRPKLGSLMRDKARSLGCVTSLALVGPTVIAWVGHKAIIIPRSIHIGRDQIAPFNFTDYFLIIIWSLTFL